MTKKGTLCYLALAALVVALPAGASSADEPGLTRTTVLLGGTVPLSGPASRFGVIGPSANAYFKHVNARGGVHGRRIVYKYLDDGYDPSRTVEATRRLVQQERVFAIFNSAGTEHNLAIRPFLNAAKVPQLFGGTGASAIGRGYRRFPWTLGFLPSFVGEGVIYGRYIARTRPRARIAVLYENSDYGKDLLAGLRRGLGRRAGAIVARQTYDVFDADVNSQVASLKASRANTLMIFALPLQMIQTVNYARKLGWRPKVFISAVSIEPTTMTVASVSAPRQTEGAISIAFVKDPTAPEWAKDPTVQLYRRIMRRYYPRGRPADVYNFYGMTVAHTMVETLRRAGRNPTRRSLLRAATHLDQRNPFLRPGIRVQTSPRNYFPIGKAQLMRYEKRRWRPVGPLVTAR